MKARRSIVAWLVAGWACWASAAVGFDDGIDRSDPDFIKASLMLTSPGNMLYSCAGHIFLRLECPRFDLDYCFSYESEPVEDRVMTFFAGKLMMGLFAVPSEDFFKPYRAEGRGILQYPLNLPPEAKIRLWKILDDKAAEGSRLPYDYIRRGCSWAVLSSIRAALAPQVIGYPPWPAKYEMSRREIIASGLEAFPWTKAALHAIVGWEGDKTNTNIEKVVMPTDLIEFLQSATIEGRPIIAGEPIEVLPMPPPPKPSVITPLIVAWAIVFVMVANLFWKKRFLDWILLSFQALAGFLFVYLLCFSHLPATDWNWLVIPFNPLPLLFWRWRRWWAWPYVAVLVVWEGFLFFSPHRLTDAAYPVLVLGYIALYVRAARAPSTYA